MIPRAARAFIRTVLSPFVGRARQMKPGDLFVSGDRHEPTALFVVVGAYDPAREQWPVVRITWDGRGPETGFWNVTTNFLDLSPAPLPEDVGFVKVSEGHPNVWDRVRIR